ncbi:MAG: hypothetical protein CFE21_14715 [Bacteroidetes bacterium B1(2017)]|nr:MAG: hypothetical protein CFE21_14715 [Bacteroidetes bacterium B1(2017)]
MIKIKGRNSVSALYLFIHFKTFFMKKIKLIYALPLTVIAIFLTQFGFTKLVNFTSTTRAWDAIGPGITVRKDCTGCHTDVAPVTQDNTHRIFTLGAGLTKYKPGEVHTVKFKILGAGPVGFSCTVLKNDSNIMCGTLAVVDTNETKLFLHAASGRYYMNHRVGATADGVKEYTFSWTAPAKGSGPVTFYFSSLSSNGDDATTDDTTYQNSYVIEEGIPTSLSSVSSNSEVKVFPNPALDRIGVNFTNTTKGTTKITLISMDGKEAVTLLNDELEMGEQKLSFDLSGKVQSGVYFLSISNGTHRSIQKILIY